MDTISHQRCDGCIDQSMAFELRTASECCGDEHDTEMATLTCARVTSVLRAVINDFERNRCQLALQRLAQLLDSVGLHKGCQGWGEGSPLLAEKRRTSHATCAPMNTKLMAVRPITLKRTQTYSLKLNATNKLSAPKAT